MRIKAIVNESDPRQDTYIRFLKKAFPETLVEEDPEMFYVIGGDGSMLHAHKNYPNIDIPFFGKGMGTLNFIMNNFSHDFRIIEGLQNGSIVPDIVSAQKIRVEVLKASGERIDPLYAINDVVIGSSIMDWNKFIINSEFQSFEDFEFAGMGICISTPLGSTAFNVNNGGKVLPINSKMWSVTGIVSERKIDELMLPQNMSVHNITERNIVDVFIDGTTQRIPLEKGDEVRISKCSETFKIAFLNLKEFFTKRTTLIQTRR
jgi:NAD+ kinase